jgi:hypothetical protein
VKDAILRKARESADVKEQFFRAEADRIEALARALAAAPPTPSTSPWSSAIRSSRSVDPCPRSR